MKRLSGAGPFTDLAALAAQNLTGRPRPIAAAFRPTMQGGTEGRYLPSAEPMPVQVDVEFLRVRAGHFGTEFNTVSTLGPIQENPGTVQKCTDLASFLGAQSPPCKT